MTFRNGLNSLLRPEDSVLVLIDHQPYQLANVNSHEPQMDGLIYALFPPFRQLNRARV